MTGPGVQLNLHTHLEGSVRPATAAEIARAAGVPEPVQGWDRALQMRDAADLTVFLSHVAAVYPVLGTREAVHRAAREAVEDAAADGQAYLELRLGPGTHARDGFCVDDVLAAACDGVAEGVAATGIYAGVVACMLRHEPDDVLEQVVRSAVNLAGSGVVGLDVAGDELLLPALHRYGPHFARARAAGLGVTAHAAEAGPASAAREAVELLGVTRIGHGSHLADDPTMLAWVRDQGVAVEVCPSSNVLTGAALSMAAHPVRTFVEAGLRVVLGDDDPVTTGVRLVEESQLLVDRGGLGRDVVTDFHRTAVEVAFCSDAERADLRSRLANP